MSVSVCVCLSDCDHIFGTTRPIFTEICAHVTDGCGLVLFRWRDDMLCISGFIGDVLHLHIQLRLLDVACQAEAARLTRSLGLHA